MNVVLPNNWDPRPYQLSAWGALERGIKRVFLFWHRRSGKDDMCLHWTCIAAHKKIGTYWHMLPQANQARKAIWDAVNPHTGKRRIDEAFPEVLRAATRDNEMMIKFKSGSTWQVVGSDNYNALVGSPPVGVVFSEYALADPDSWAFLRPILAENGGWALFVTTPRGRNHAHKLMEAAKRDPTWFAEVLTVDDTKAIAPEVIEQERKELIAERGEREANSIIQQEYYCSVDANIPGSIYGPEIKRAEDEGRILDLPYDTRYTVTTAWDLGTGDATAITFGQPSGKFIDIIDYCSAAGQGPSYFAKQLKNERDYAYKIHLFPHDGNQRHWSADGGTASSVAKKMGIWPIRVMAKTSVENRIRATRALFPQFRFARGKCDELIDALRNYQYEWDSVEKVFKKTPLHNWASNGSDSFGYFAQGFRNMDYDGPPRRSVADTEYEIFG